jgi:RNA 2',3'-cyclic 3'-phosphodiesterase
MRLFVAVRPPASMTEGIREPHVTLRFLGDVDDALVEEVAAAMRSGLAGVAACEATIGTGVRRLGAGALVVPVSGLDEVAAAVAAAVGRYGGDDRPFRGHLTVARRRRGAPAPDRTVMPTGGTWVVGEVLLVRSELGKGPGGTARHTVVARVALAGDAGPSELG